jgi:hypothetical protein
LLRGKLRIGQLLIESMREEMDRRTLLVVKGLSNWTNRSWIGIVIQAHQPILHHGLASFETNWG